MFSRPRLRAITRRSRMLAAAAVLFGSSWLVLGISQPASASLPMSGVSYYQMQQYCNTKLGGSLNFIPPGNAYSWVCDVNGRHTGMNMTAVCRWVNRNDPVHDPSTYDQVDLLHFDHPDTVSTGWGCVSLDHPRSAWPLTPQLLLKYCQTFVTGTTGVKDYPPGWADDWYCLSPNGQRYQDPILMDTACNRLSGNNNDVTVRVTNVYRNLIVCVR